MLRTVFLLGVFVLLGMIALRLVFGIFGGLIALLFWLLWKAVGIAILGLIVYVIIKIVSPDTARKIRAALSGKE